MTRRCHRSIGRVRLDLMVSIAVMATLSAVLLERLVYYLEYAEKTVTELTITNLRTGLMLRKAEMMMNFAQDRPVTAIGDNPMDWLPAPVPNYSGEYRGRAPAHAGDGIWYFDGASRELAYRPNLMRHFVPAEDGVAEVRVRVTRQVEEAAGGPSQKRQPWEGVSLVLARSYRWF